MTPDQDLELLQSLTGLPLELEDGACAFSTDEHEVWLKVLPDLSAWLVHITLTPVRPSRRLMEAVLRENYLRRLPQGGAFSLHEGMLGLNFILPAADDDPERFLTALNEALVTAAQARERYLPPEENSAPDTLTADANFL